LATHSAPGKTKKDHAATQPSLLFLRTFIDFRLTNPSVKGYPVSSMPCCIFTFTCMQNLEQPKQSSRTGAPTKTVGESIELQGQQQQHIILMLYITSIPFYLSLTG
jgi:hypothetical protein